MMTRILAALVGILTFQIHIVSSFSDEELRSVFQMMRKESEAELQNLPENSKKATRNQVLSFLVLSDLEITNLNLIPTERFQILINQKPKDIRVEEYFTNKDSVEIHGEIIALYINDTINTLLKAFDQVNRKLIPNVLVYSHYIPCANVQNIPYSCAEEIGKAATYLSEKCDMYVAFSQFFEFTDAPAAIDFLLDSRIKSVINLVTHQLPERSQNIKTTLYFQQELFTRLLNRVTGCKDGADKEAFVAYQINDFVQTCTQMRTGPRSCSIFYGSISTLGLNCLGDCLISQKWVPCCKKAPQADIFGTAVGECIAELYYQSKSTAKLQFGMPRRGNLVDKLWTPIENIEMRAWVDLFSDVKDLGGEGEKLKQSDIICSEGGSFTGRANAHPLGKLLQRVREYPNIRQRQRQKGGPTKN